MGTCSALGKLTKHRTPCDSAAAGLLFPTAVSQPKAPHPVNTLKRLWDKLRTSFWLFPSAIVIGSIAMAVALIAGHTNASTQWLTRWPLIFGASAEGARGMLSTIAGSMMTVVGVTFSMTLVTLALASGQYTSRILRNFMRDRVTQVVLGIFAGIFVYCLIVLRTIRGGGNGGGFVPDIAVSFSVVLATIGIGVLIFFIHHVASSIQASTIIAAVAHETLTAVDRLFPERFGKEEPGEDDSRLTLALSDERWHPVPANESGYVEGLDESALMVLAREHDSIVRMERGIGEFVVDGTTLVSLTLEEPPDEALIAALQAAYSIGRHRTLQQDCAFGIRQLVDMALRALSPSTNDTTTAVMCVDYLTAILARLASRDVPSSYRHEDGELRVITKGQTFASLVNASFDQIRVSATGNVAVMLRMLGALQTVGSLTSSPGRLLTLGRQVDAIAELAERTVESSQDRARFESRLAHVREALQRFGEPKSASS